MKQNHRQRISVRPVKRDQWSQIDVAEIVSVNDDNFVYIVGQIPIGGDGASRAQEYWLINLDKAQPALSVDLCNMGTHNLCQSMGVYPRLSDAAFDETLNPDIKEWLTGNWNQAFRDRISQGAQSRSQPSCQQERPGTFCMIRHRARFRLSLNSE
jgi:hypothetical protein